MNSNFCDFCKIALILRPTDEIIILIATLTIVELESYESYGIGSAGNRRKDFNFGASLGFLYSVMILFH